MRRLAASICTLVLAVSAAVAAETGKLEPFRFVLLRRAADAPKLPRERSLAIRTEHVAYLERLMAEGKVVLFGPFVDQSSLAGVVVFDTDDDAAAREWIAADPWVRAGVFEPEIHPWWSARYVFAKPAPGAGRRHVLLGLLRRPEGAPDYPKERLDEIQRGHMANIEAMANSGDLVIAGPCGDDGELRGVFVFGNTDEARVRELASKDPAFEAGRLVMDLHRWSVPDGSIASK